MATQNCIAISYEVPQINQKQLLQSKRSYKYNMPSASAREYTHTMCSINSSKVFYTTLNNANTEPWPLMTNSNIYKIAIL